MRIRKIVFAGGPATGKSATLKALHQKGCHCMEEVSREVTKEAQAQGIEQLFLEDPLLFSQKLLEKRIEQYQAAEKLVEKVCFFDRGIPEVTAYMNYKNEPIPGDFIEANKKHTYDQVFIFPIWEEIYETDQERYESLEEAIQIDKYIRKTYRDLGYRLIEVPKGSVLSRIDFILNQLQHVITK